MKEEWGGTKVTKGERWKSSWGEGFKYAPLCCENKSEQRHKRQMDEHTGAITPKFQEEKQMLFTSPFFNLFHSCLYFYCQNS